MDKILEICCGEIGAVWAAKDGGATRIELCSGLEEGGVTPSIALIKAAVATGIPEVNVLIRHRPGDFIYSHEQVCMMQDDIREAVRAGATGVVIGALTPDGDIDTYSCQIMIETARSIASAVNLTDLNITFHRAFDVCRNPEESLEKVIELGCNCLLTSGLAPTAQEGIPMLRKLIDQAKSRIKIIAGAGVNPANAAKILSLSGVDGIHSTARRVCISQMEHRAKDVSFGEDRLITMPDLVKALADIAQSCYARL